MTDSDKKYHIEEEVFVVENSGEIPEVTLYESLYHLSEDPDGPSLKLDAEDIIPLKQAVFRRYRAIILRDLDPGNRDKRIYRGLARCNANWQRLQRFCLRENMDYGPIRDETAGALVQFLENEIRDVQSSRRSSCINCSLQEIEILVHSLGVSQDNLPEGWQDLCSSA